MMRALLLLPFAAVALQAQSVPPVDEQVAAAVLAAPAELRAGATVMGYREPGTLVVLRQGTNALNCLALYVTRPDFHVACYHKDLEPFMARGRALRAEGVTGAQVDSVRFREVRAGTLKLPAMGVLHTVTAPKANFDAATRTVKEAGTLTVLYVPNATGESLGITTRPRNDGPWLMSPGTLKAHVMMAGKM